MTDVWELAAYVEAHPNKHDQRWRLAKKLYTSWEYRLALEHLLVLKNEIEPRENVMRYLAATYYRLGRYEESIGTLKDALKIWPKDTRMREQLARTQGEANHHADSLESWKILREDSPEHPFASQAIARLQKIVDREAREKEASKQPVKVSAPGITNGTETATAEPAMTPKEVHCPKCGQKNSAEFKRCWKCNAELTHSEDFLDGVIKKTDRPDPARLPLPMLTGILIAGLFAASVYVTLRGVAHVETLSSDGRSPASVTDFLDITLLWTRVALGAVLFVGWPIAWRLAAYLTNVENQIYNESLYRAGILCALTAYLLLWTPWRWMIGALIAPAVISAIVAFLFLKLPAPRASRVWIWQFAVAALLAITLIVSRHGPGLLFTAPQIASFARESGTRPPYEGEMRAPGQIRVKWQPSGSSWLDSHANSMRLTLHAEHERRMFLDTIEDGKTLSFEQLSGNEHVEDRKGVRVGVPYQFDVRSDDPVDVRYTIVSLLPFTVEQTAAP